MKQLGLRSILKRNFIVTTDSKHDLPVAGNELKRDFTCDKPGVKWVSDITYVRVGSK